jgi:hypothetical protein
MIAPAMPVRLIDDWKHRGAPSIRVAGGLT